MAFYPCKITFISLFLAVTCSVWDLSFLTGDQPLPPAVKCRVQWNWAKREVPRWCFSITCKACIWLLFTSEATVLTTPIKFYVLTSPKFLYIWWFSLDSASLYLKSFFYLGWPIVPAFLDVPVLALKISHPKKLLGLNKLEWLATFLTPRLFHPIPSNPILASL